jgi:hypothetical protein
LGAVCTVASVVGLPTANGGHCGFITGFLSVVREMDFGASEASNVRHRGEAEQRVEHLFLGRGLELLLR